MASFDTIKKFSLSTITIDVLAFFYALWSLISSLTIHQLDLFH